MSFNIEEIDIILALIETLNTCYGGRHICDIFPLIKNNLFINPAIDIQAVLQKCIDDGENKINQINYKKRIENNDLISIINFIIRKLENKDTKCISTINNKMLLLFLINSLDDNTLLIAPEKIRKFITYFNKTQGIKIENVASILFKKAKITSESLCQLFLKPVDMYGVQITTEDLEYLKHSNILLQIRMNLIEENINKILFRNTIISSQNPIVVETLLNKNLIVVDLNLIKTLLNIFTTTYNKLSFECVDNFVRIYNNCSYQIYYEKFKKLLERVISQNHNLINLEILKTFLTDICKFKEVICGLINNRYELPNNFIKIIYTDNIKNNLKWGQIIPPIYVAEIVTLAINVGMFTLTYEDFTTLTKNNVILDQYIIDKLNLKITQEIVDIFCDKEKICPYKTDPDVMPNTNTLLRMIKNKTCLKTLKEFQRKYNIKLNNECLEMACCSSRNLQTVKWILSFDSVKNPIYINKTCVTNIINAVGNSEIYFIYSMFMENTKDEIITSKEEIKKQEIKKEEEELVFDEEIIPAKHEKKEEKMEDKKEDKIRIINKLDKPKYIARKKYAITSQEIYELLKCEPKETFLNFKKSVWTYMLTNKLMSLGHIEFNNNLIKAIKSLMPDIEIKDKTKITIAEFDNMIEHIFNEFC